MKYENKEIEEKKENLMKNSWENQAHLMKFHMIFCKCFKAYTNIDLKSYSCLWNDHKKCNWKIESNILLLYLTTFH